MRILLLLLILDLGHSCLGQRRTWISLRSSDGQWLSAQEIIKGQEYWLRPSPLLESARRCDTCSFNELVLSVRFWEQNLLETAQTCLRRQGFCQKEDPCRVTPYQAERLLLGDGLQRWHTVTPWVPISGMVPETQDFLISATQDAENAANSSLTSDGLRSFYVSVVSSDLSAPAGTQQLIFTGEDLLLAHRLLKTPGSKNDLIDRGSLRKLAAWLLKMKARDMNWALPHFPAIVTSLERQLTVTSVKFRSGMEKLLPRWYRAKEGELFFVLKKMEPTEQIAVTFAPNIRLTSITMLLKSAKLFKFDTAQAKPSIEREELVQKNDTARPGNIEQEVYRVVKKIFNISNTNNHLDIPLLREQVSQLAKISKATHVLDRDNIKLTAINDCFQIKQNGMQENVYYLRSIQRPVLCTKDGDVVVLKRSGGQVNFNESWARYEQGLGDVRDGDFFIGLRALSSLTQKNDVCMSLILTPQNLIASSRLANYDSFRVAPESDKYRLSYAEYNGNLVFDILAVMNNQQFSTFDRDNDLFIGSCAKRFQSGNWFRSCMKANIFGPYRNDPTSGMCSIGLLRSQGDMCVALASVRMLLRRKEHSSIRKKIVFSTIAPKSSCKAKLQFFTVTAAGTYTVTVGGAQGGRYNNEKVRLGGRGAKITAKFYFEKGTRLAASAGCRGSQATGAGNGGDASWLVSRTRGILLAVAGGGGGASRYNCGIFLPGMPGRASADGGDSWWSPFSDSQDANSTLLVKNFGHRAKGWPDLRDRLLSASSGDFSSGGNIGNCNGGGGGGGFQGGVGCPTDNCHGGGGGGSFCNTTAADSCDISAGENYRPYGYVILERDYCF